MVVTTVQLKQNLLDTIKKDPDSSTQITAIILNMTLGNLENS